MLTTILEVAGLLAVIIVPMAGPAKKKQKRNTYTIDTDVSHAHYAVNEEGNLVEIHPELSRYSLWSLVILNFNWTKPPVWEAFVFIYLSHFDKTLSFW